ncbi:MAG: alpha-L-fucosidase [Muribaculum sp.]|nr:alpha-L-fucosidase [Muribaculum sp.]
MITLRNILILAAILCSSSLSAYTPSAQVQKSQREFAADRFGIFIHWGIYSMFGQGEWYLNSGLNESEYSKAAAAFFPAAFDAYQWAEAIAASGARYITFTSRHHDGFSMWHTATSDYNIVDATPFRRDVIRELADACSRHSLKLHLYYSHLDWRRPDYPLGRTGLNTGRPTDRQDWPSYRRFMDTQLRELLTQYGPIRAIWFDGYWDHDSDSIPFDWQLDSQYALVHSLQPACMVANNHHVDVLPGEDIQIFERDVPGENNAGYSTQALSMLPRETCQTMNGMWGYKVMDTDYKSTPELIRLLVRCAGMGANLLLNIGPQPDGRLPELALDRLRGIGQWLQTHGETIYGTTAGDIAPQPWGATTRLNNKLFVHILCPDSLPSTDLRLPLKTTVRSAAVYDSGAKIKFLRHTDGGVVLPLDTAAIRAAAPDYIITLTTR